MRRFYWRWFTTAVRHPWGVADAIRTVSIGSAAFVALRPNNPLHNLGWQVCAALSIGTIGARLVLAPWWLYQEVSEENRKLRDAADQRVTKHTASERLAAAHHAGVKLKGEIRSNREGEGSGNALKLEFVREVAKWRKDMKKAIAECLSPARAQWVDTAPLPRGDFWHRLQPDHEVPYFAGEMETWIEVRLTRLSDLLREL